MEALLELVQSGELGDVRLAKASFGYALPLWRPNRDYRETYSAHRDQGGGVLLDAIHELDDLNLLLGMPSSVSALATRVSDLAIDVEDTVIAHLGYENGAVATVDLNFFEPAYRRGCLLVGSDASAAWGTETTRRSVSGAPAARNASSTCHATFSTPIVASWPTSSTQSPRVRSRAGRRGPVWMHCALRMPYVCPALRENARTSSRLAQWRLA